MTAPDPGARRVVSFLPAATEIVAALGCADRLVGVSHECDFPPQVRRLPAVSRCTMAADADSAAVDAWVSAGLARGAPLYEIDAERLRRLAPDLVLTQGLCAVCAPDPSTLAKALADLPRPPRLLSLEAHDLAGVLASITAVADALGEPARGEALIERLHARLATLSRALGATVRRPRTAVIEWLDPLYCCGHWTPELVALAGGEEVFGRPGRPSVRRTWEALADAAPEVLVIACCGQDAARAARDWQPLRRRAEVAALPAVRSGRVHLVDGNAYFNRPGPRLIDSAERLADLLHPRRAGARDCSAARAAVQSGAATES